MKLTFTWSNDGRDHAYCIGCHSETVERRQVDGKTQYYCNICHRPYDRWIKIDPAINWWLADDGEYWHESSGVFVRNDEGRFLFFTRNIFPFALTVPAGHVDTGETAEIAAQRELEEEVGMAGALIHVVTEDIIGDACSRGSDAHLWHAFLMLTHDTPQVEVREEGSSPVWLTLEEALEQHLTVPVRHIIETYGKQLMGNELLVAE